MSGAHSSRLIERVDYLLVLDARLVRGRRRRRQQGQRHVPWVRPILIKVRCVHLESHYVLIQGASALINIAGGRHARGCQRLNRGGSLGVGLRASSLQTSRNFATLLLLTVLVFELAYDVACYQ